MFRRVFLAIAVLVSLMALPVAAQEDWEIEIAEVEDLEHVVAASPDCALGVVYDDGGIEAGYSIGPGNAGAVMRFDLPGGTTGLDQVCTCFSRDAGAPSTMGFDVVVYDNNGPSGGPGTFLGSVHSTATSIPVFPNGQFYDVNLVGSGISLPDQNVFVGVIWPGGSPSIYICGDRSATTTQRTNFGSGNGGTSWTNMNSLFLTNPPRALGIRVDPLADTGDCVPSTTAMCLNNNRFEVRATFRTATQATTPAQVVKLTDDTGYLWFFSSTNVEILVKVLNACGFPSAPRYWVFAAGLTNVEVTIAVTDTQTGAVKTYTNPLNTPFPPKQDTNAFATCP